jgi:hypothetical protein
MAHVLLNYVRPCEKHMNTIELMEPEEQATKPQEVIQLPLGLLGFERVKKYILLGKPGELLCRFHYLAIRVLCGDVRLLANR